MHSIEWAAGLFEGEGCITNMDNKRGRKVCKMQMTDLDVLQTFQEVVGMGGIVGPNKIYKEHHKPSWTWSITGKQDIIKFLSTMLPYFHNRRAYKALNILDDLEL